MTAVRNASCRVARPRNELAFMTAL
jgi:hypothetical protein